MADTRITTKDALLRRAMSNTSIALKKRIIPFLVIAFIFLLSACGNGSGTANNLFNTFLFGSEEDVEKIVGTVYEYNANIRNKYSEYARAYENVSFNGNKGKLIISYFYKISGSNVVHWIYNKGDNTIEQYEKIIKKYVNLFDKQYGEHKWEDNSYVWHSVSGNVIKIKTGNSSFEIYGG